MNHNRKTLIAIAAGGTALVLTAGTAMALTAGGDRTTAPVAAARTSTSTGEPTSSTGADPSTPAAASISRETAIELALHRAGGGTVREVETEVEHGRLEWTIQVAGNGQRFDVRIDAVTGAVTRVDTDRQNNDPGADDHGVDHRRGHAEPGDGHGGHAEPGDGHGGHAEPGDDHGSQH